LLNKLNALMYFFILYSEISENPLFCSTLTQQRLCSMPYYSRKQPISCTLNASAHLSNVVQIQVACKRRSSVNSRAWLRRFDDVTRVEKSCIAKSKKGKKSEGKVLYACNLICVSPKHGIHRSFRCLKILYIHNCRNLFFRPRTIGSQTTKNYKTSKYTLLA